MNFIKHLDLEGKHAPFSASKYSWVNYDEEKLIQTYRNQKAVEEGTLTHEFASLCIKRNQKLPAKKQTLNMFVNDAIGFKMSSEVILYYSLLFFGTTDAISYRLIKQTGRYELRIHDLKTGVTPAHFEQLMIYAALFCLEYRVKPADIDIVLRLYQCDEIQEYIPELDEIAHIMDKIITFNKLLEEENRKDEV